MSEIAQLNSKFGIPGVVEVIANRGGLAAVRVLDSSESKGATGTVYLHGGHVAAWRPRGTDEVLWLSEKSAWEPTKPIRGGVPICFPWFGPRKDAVAGAPPSPPHGFARLRGWSLQTIQKSPAGIVITLALSSNHETRQIWPHDFVLRQHVTIGPELVMALELTNPGPVSGGRSTWGRIASRARCLGWMHPPGKRRRSRRPLSWGSPRSRSRPRRGRQQNGGR